MELLKNKVAIVTGGSRGLGKAIALKFAYHGASLILVATNQDRLNQAAEEVRNRGAKAEIVAGDIAKPAFSEEIVKVTLDHFGQIDVLVNCAGVITRTPVEKLPLEDWYRVIDVNLHGTFHACRAVLPFMRRQASGKIINMTSQMAKLPHPSASPSYEVSKAGQIALTRHLAYHYAQYNICINAIAPGSINTDLPKSMNPEARERLRSAIPLRRLGEPDEVADCALFLATSLSDYITGETIDINGGTLMD
ncbi:3-oxoacyl-[acyl-carrier-protein] reductase [Candidatus Thiomargarita nelsonii]|uniref:3-oxoacyl-[acyl-carrier-protein] reductase n=1 Tax=Candidatus Thiomargarita nelsonii TaxID=1003181 RepID=A0A0A6NYQ4_9GAMM|nr:3-oxoacyl-[acyl-carrier-protein] reductase [Candidatus Thiomargarita nelsonii]